MVVWWNVLSKILLPALLLFFLSPTLAFPEECPSIEKLQLFGSRYLGKNVCVDGLFSTIDRFSALKLQGGEFAILYIHDGKGRFVEVVFPFEYYDRLSVFKINEPIRIYGHVYALNSIYFPKFQLLKIESAKVNLELDLHLKEVE